MDMNLAKPRAMKMQNFVRFCVALFFERVCVFFDSSPSVFNSGKRELVMVVHSEL